MNFTGLHEERRNTPDCYSSLQKIVTGVRRYRPACLRHLRLHHRRGWARSRRGKERRLSKILGSAPPTD